MRFTSKFISRVTLTLVLGMWLVVGASGVRAAHRGEPAKKAGPDGASPAYSVVHVVDGDTAILRVDGHTKSVRLSGIDGDIKQGGAAALRRMIEGQKVQLEYDHDLGVDKEGRPFVKLYKAEDGSSVNAAIAQAVNQKAPAEAAAKQDKPNAVAKRHMARPPIRRHKINDPLNQDFPIAGQQQAGMNNQGMMNQFGMNGFNQGLGMPMMNGGVGWPGMGMNPMGMGMGGMGGLGMGMGGLGMGMGGLGLGMGGLGLGMGGFGFPGMGMGGMFMPGFGLGGLGFGALGFGGMGFGGGLGIGGLGYAGLGLGGFGFSPVLATLPGGFIGGLGYGAPIGYNYGYGYGYGNGYGYNVQTQANPNGQNALGQFFGAVQRVNSAGSFGGGLTNQTLVRQFPSNYTLNPLINPRAPARPNGSAQVSNVAMNHGATSANAGASSAHSQINAVANRSGGANHSGYVPPSSHANGAGGGLANSHELYPRNGFSQGLHGGGVSNAGMTRTGMINTPNHAGLAANGGGNRSEFGGGALSHGGFGSGGGFGSSGGFGGVGHPLAGGFPVHELAGGGGMGMMHPASLAGMGLHPMAAMSGGMGMMHPAAFGGMGMHPAAFGGMGMMHPAAFGGMGMMHPMAIGGVGMMHGGAIGGGGMAGGHGGR